MTLACAECGASVEGQRRTRRVCADCKYARQRRWAIANCDAMRAAYRRHHERNKENRNAYGRAYGMANRERLAERQRADYAANPEPYREKVKRRSALTRGAAAANFSSADWRMMVYLFGHKCFYCGSADRPLTQDHLTPLARGGAHVWDNIVPACQSCNSRKNARTLSEFIEKEMSHAAI